MNTTSSTTSTNTSNISGLSSGLQWTDLIDASIAAMEARTVAPITDRITKRNAQKTAWTTLQDLVTKLNSSALSLRKTGFGGFTAAATTSPSSGRSLVTASASSTATAGRYRVEVQQLAETAKLGGSSVADTAAARGLTGSLTVNGVAVTVVSTDSLGGIRDKINAANAGVSATIISEGGTAGRLVLTAASSGAGSITLSDDAAQLSRELGFVDTRSRHGSSAVTAAAAAMGMSVFPNPASIRVGNVTITADLSVESIASIAAKIHAAGGAASVESEAFGNETRYRLVVDGTVSAVNGDPNSQAVIDALGFAAGQSGTVRQTAQSGVFTTSADAIVTSSSSLVGLKVDGVASGLAVGDAINLRGVRGDGTAVSYGLVIQAGDTMQTLVDRINDAGSAFGSGTRTATASLGADGRIRLTDDTGGPSRLAFSLTASRADGSTGSLSSGTTSVAGRSRELQQGRDAMFVVDGQQFTRSSNTITDAIGGVTMTLQSAEVGTTVDLAVARNTQGATDAAKGFVDAYNAIRAFYDQQRVADAPLYADSSLRRVMSSLTTALRTQASGNSTYTAATLVGMTLDRDGKLTLDQSTFSKAFTEKPTEVEALFGLSGIGGAFVQTTDAAMQFGVGPISTNLSGIAENVLSLTSKQAEAQKRLEARRAQLVEQYTRMEEALKQLQSQSNSLISSITGLQQSG